MGYDICVNGGSFSNFESWAKGFELFGCRVVFESDFDPFDCGVWAPGLLTLSEESEFQKRFEVTCVESTPFYFQFSLFGFWIDAPINFRERRASNIREYIRRLKEKNAPSPVIEFQEDELEILKLADIDSIREYRRTRYLDELERCPVPEWKNEIKRALNDLDSTDWVPDFPMITLGCGTLKSAELLGTVLSAAALAKMTGAVLEDVRGPTGGSYSHNKIDLQALHSILEKVIGRREF